MLWSLGLALPSGLHGQHNLDSLSWYLPVSNECRLFVAERGSGDPVVVLHGGWGAEHSYLHDPLLPLEDRYRFIFYDQRGSLRSPCADSLVTVDRHVGDLEALRVELGSERLTLFGHSMGTFLAMSYLERYPERVEGLVLAGAIIPRTPRNDEEAALYREEQAAARAFVERPEIEAEIARQGLDREDLSARERTFAWRIRFTGANVFHVARWREMRGGQVFYSHRAGSAAGRSMPQEWDFTDDLERHPYPVTVILGDHDIVGMGAELHRRLLAPLERVELVMLERAGHNAWIDAPEEFRRTLERALANYGG